MEASGEGLLVRAGHQATAAQPRVVTLPERAHGWSVTDEAGSAVCRHCQGFSSALGAGEVAAFIAAPETQPRPAAAA